MRSSGKLRCWNATMSSAAGYATWRLHRSGAIEWRLLARVTAPSLATAFLGGLLVLEGRSYFVLTGLLLVLAWCGPAWWGPVAARRAGHQQHGENERAA
jgi:uncharacterized membrane protein YfcA